MGPKGSATFAVTSKSPLAKNVAIDWDASGIKSTISCKLTKPDLTLNGQLQSIPISSNAGNWAQNVGLNESGIKVLINEHKSA